MKPVLFLLALGTLVGCYDYDTFADERFQTSCDKMDECGYFTAYFTYEDCLAIGDIEDTGLDVWECGNYDSRAARECVDAWAAISCDVYMVGTGLESCDDVCTND